MLLKVVVDKKYFSFSEYEETISIIESKLSVFKEELAQEVNNKTDAKVTHKIVIDFLNIF